MVVAAGADFMKLVSNCIQFGRLEQAARLIPQAAIATTRFINTIHSLGPNGRYNSRNCDGEAGQCSLATRPHRPNAGYNVPGPVWADYSKFRLNLWLLRDVE